MPDTHPNNEGLAQHDAYDGASVYSRDRYGDDRSAHSMMPSSAPTAQELYPEISRLRKRKQRRKRIVRIVVCVLLLALVSCGAYAAWFVNQLDSALEADPETRSELEGILTPEVPGQPYYILILGSDSREGNYSGRFDERGDNERSDVMMLARIDKKNSLVTLLSIPRDTPYRLEDGSYVKINEMFNEHGFVGAITAVGELTGLPISHYAQVRISGLEAIVDLLGGITVDVPTDISYTTTDKEEITISAGRQKLNGREAQIFSRARHEYEGNQDEHRQDNVRQLMTAIINEAMNRPVSEIPNIILQMAQYVDTDFKTLDIVSLATAFSGEKMKIYSATGPSNGDYNEGAGNKWMCFLNPDGWEKAASIMDSGDDPRGIDYSDTEIPWSEVTDQPKFSTSRAHDYYYA